MPAEAIHLSALSDSIEGSRARAFLSGAGPRYAARVGATFIDTPYFDRFPIAVMRYVLKRPVSVSRWGDVFHHRAPAGLGKAFLRQARRLRERTSTREAGDLFLGFALGYFSHLAIDSGIHPSVNRIAKVRAARLNDSPSRQHNEVEKFQSIIFHEERHGFDFMGKSFLQGFIEADGNLLYDQPDARDALALSMREVLGEYPGIDLLRRWNDGYRQYGWLISGPAGLRVAPPALKEEVRPEVYEGVDGPFVERFRVGVVRSRRYLDAAFSFAEGELSEAELDATAPEGSIDEPPYASEH